MSRTLPKSVIESKPLHAVAGAGDLAVEKIRGLSKLAADKVSAVEADPTAVSNRIQEGIEQRAGTLGTTLRGASTDVRVQLHDISEKAQQALQAAFVQANQTYEALAERGRDVVVRFGGEDGHQLETKPAPAPAPAPRPTAETKPAPAPAPAPRPTAEAKPAPRKKSSASSSSTSSTPKSTATRKTSRTTGNGTGNTTGKKSS